MKLIELFVITAWRENVEHDIQLLQTTIDN